MRPKVLIVRDYDLSFHQHLTTKTSLDCDAIASHLKRSGYEVEWTTYDDILQTDKLWSTEGQYVFYTSSQIAEYKTYIDSVLYPLHLRNTLLPNYALFRCHDDKAFQCIYGKRVGLESPKTFVFATLADLRKHQGTLSFPAVLKLPSGFGSVGVWKVDSADECSKRIRSLFEKKRSSLSRVKRLVQHTISRDRDSVNREYDDECLGRYVLQEFIPGLSGDWRVLVFCDRFYALNRGVRPGDFRASGSGRRAFDQPPRPLLAFAQQCYEKLDTPFASLDIASNENGFYLLEFQATHFGPYTQIASPSVFMPSDDDSWREMEKTDNSAQTI